MAGSLAAPRPHIPSLIPKHAQVINNSNKKMLLQLTGSSPVLTNGLLTVQDRSGGYLASAADGIAWSNAENVLVLPLQQEWSKLP